MHNENINKTTNFTAIGTPSNQPKIKQENIDAKEIAIIVFDLPKKSETIPATMGPNPPKIRINPAAIEEKSLEKSSLIPCNRNIPKMKYGNQDLTAYKIRACKE